MARTKAGQIRRLDALRKQYPALDEQRLEEKALAESLVHARLLSLGIVNEAFAPPDDEPGIVVPEQPKHKKRPRASEERLDSHSDGKKRPRNSKTSSEDSDLEVDKSESEDDEYGVTAADRAKLQTAARRRQRQRDRLKKIREDPERAREKYERDRANRKKREAAGLWR
ncbi:hypothetical protein CYLTODRAFT_489127 [Cylindrobasidium torrendii FP15055 ss-10]|uniref:Uncharacterized protein n=1 Tax=Cylindrobasidium torrendii FP15055 ss-10 TaxID=1314674 RepID=A0A0D7BFD5_9AGAR|nr:hypothetical protein CYLTODRAFT_489127 [Cylindrobasidium torrendii FP15055 ss-10]